jgi:hypothetical protein
MVRTSVSIFVLVTVMAVCIVVAKLFAPGASYGETTSPIYGVAVPPGYRQWEVIAPSEEVGLNELRVIVGNGTAIKAYKNDTLPFPDGSVLVKIAWRRVPSTEAPGAIVPGAPTTVQVMVKDSKRYASTDGWGFGRFINGQPTDETQHETCYACHNGHVKGHDLVFTRWAP